MSYQPKAVILFYAFEITSSFPSIEIFPILNFDKRTILTAMMAARHPKLVA